MDALAKVAEKSSADDFLRYLIALQQGEQGLKFSSHPRIYLEALLVKLCHFKKIVPLEDIIQDIESLREGIRKSTDSIPDYKGEEKPRRPKTQILEKMTTRQNETELPPAAPESPPRATETLKSNAAQKDVEFATKDPTVKYFIDTFKAQVLSVEPLKKGKK